MPVGDQVGEFGDLVMPGEAHQRERRGEGREEQGADDDLQHAARHSLREGMQAVMQPPEPEAEHGADDRRHDDQPVHHSGGKDHGGDASSPPKMIREQNMNEKNPASPASSCNPFSGPIVSSSSAAAPGGDA